MATKTGKKKRYIEAVGRRKAAIARVRLIEHSRPSITVNAAVD